MADKGFLHWVYNYINFTYNAHSSLAANVFLRSWKIMLCSPHILENNYIFTMYIYNIFWTIYNYYWNIFFWEYYVTHCILQMFTGMFLFIAIASCITNIPEALEYTLIKYFMKSTKVQNTRRILHIVKSCVLCQCTCVEIGHTLRCSCNRRVHHFQKSHTL